MQNSAGLAPAQHLNLHPWPDSHRQQTALQLWLHGQAFDRNASTFTDLAEGQQWRGPKATI
jgi:hypothetical protein